MKITFSRRPLFFVATVVVIDTYSSAPFASSRLCVEIFFSNHLQALDAGFEVVDVGDDQ